MNTAAQLPFPSGSPSPVQNTPFFPWNSNPSHRNGTIRLKEGSELLDGFGQVAFVWQLRWAGERHLLSSSDDGAVIGRIMFGRKMEWSGLSGWVGSQESWAFVWTSFIWKSLPGTGDAARGPSLVVGDREIYSQEMSQGEITFLCLKIPGFANPPGVILQRAQGRFGVS